MALQKVNAPQGEEAYANVPERHWSEHLMAEKLYEMELVTFKEMLMANSIQLDALCQLLIEKGIIAEEEFYRKLKEVQGEYERKNG